MSKKRDKKMEEIADKIVSTIFGYLMSVNEKYFEYAVRFVYATALKAMLDTFGSKETKAWMIECMVQSRMVSVDAVNDVYSKIRQDAETDEEIRPQSETLH